MELDEAVQNLGASVRCAAGDEVGRERRLAVSELLGPASQDVLDGVEQLGRPAMASIGRRPRPPLRAAPRVVTSRSAISATQPSTPDHCADEEEGEGCDRAGEGWLRADDPRPWCEVLSMDGAEGK